MRRRARCTRRSTAATTGTRASTCTGCSRCCTGASRSCRCGRRSPRRSTATSRRRRSRPRSRTSRTPHNASFERTYGWAWLLKLAHELAEGAADDADVARWSAATRAAGAGVRRALARLPAADAAIRSATASTRTARSASPSRSTTRASRARRSSSGRSSRRRSRWYAADRDAPGGVGAFGRRFPVAGAGRGRPDAARARRRRRSRAGSTRFLPGLARGEPATLFTPVPVSDRGDPQIVHLDGLNLSRAWCFAGIAARAAGRRSRARRCWRRPPGGTSTPG